jgi:uncharacterized membrane protein
MDLDLVSWLGLAIRWLHVITGIAWIGSSFYFIWLDNSLAPPDNEKDKKEGVAGHLWAVHGGGFYHKKKYQVAPEHMPPDLHWFKWEAYFTWLTGFMLLCLVYYYGAHSFLIDHAKLDISALQATLVGLGFIAGGWIIYDSLCKTRIGTDNRLFGCIWFAVLTAAAFVLTQIFTGRGAFIHVGGIIGTVMAANVLMIIIPNQRKTVAALLAGQKPDPALGKKAKQRSLHNNYMTLPVLLTMISGHYPMLYSGTFNWLILAALAAAAWPIREFFNQKHKGRVEYGYLAAGAAMFILVMLMSANVLTEKASGEKISDAEIKGMIRKHCSACHSDTPTHADWSEAPLGAKFDTMAEVKSHAEKIKSQAVDSDAMPLGNETGMTDEERKKLGDWIDQLPR